MAKRAKPPPSLYASGGRVEVLTPELPGPAVSLTEAEACRQLLAYPSLLAACEALHARLFHEQGGQPDSPWAAPLELLRKVIALARGT